MNSDPIILDYKFLIYCGLAVITIITMVVIYYKQKNRRAFAYEVLAVEPLYLLNKQTKDRLKILFDDKPVKNPIIVRFNFKNSGNESILIEDFAIPITIAFGEKNEILSADIIDVAPSNLEVCLMVSNNLLTFQPTLINAQDSFELRVILDDANENVSIDGRIKGISKITQVKDPEFIKYLLGIGFVLISIVILLDIFEIVGFNLRIFAGLGMILIFAPSIWAYGTKRGRRTMLRSSSKDQIRINEWIKSHGLK